MVHEKSRKTIFTPMAMLLISLLGVLEIEAANIRVDVYQDANTTGQCSLRSAILAANTDTAVEGCIAGSSGIDTIMLKGGTYVIGDNLPKITDSLEIIGQDNNYSKLGFTQIKAFDPSVSSSPPIYQIFYFRPIASSGKTLLLKGLYLYKGYANARPGLLGGGCVAINGSHNVTLDHVTLKYCGGTFGGGLSYASSASYTGNIATLNIKWSKIIHNSAIEGGGMYLFDPVNLNMENTEVMDNKAETKGAGIMSKSNESSLQLSSQYNIKRSSISHNSVFSLWSSSVQQGGGIHIHNLLPASGNTSYHQVALDVVITHSTIKSNTLSEAAGGAGGEGAGIYLKGGANLHVDIYNTELYDNRVYIGGFYSYEESFNIRSSEVLTTGGFNALGQGWDFGTSPWTSPLTTPGTPNANNDYLGLPSTNAGSSFSGIDKGNCLNEQFDIYGNGWAVGSTIRSVDTNVTNGNGDACDIGAYEVEAVPVVDYDWDGVLDVNDAFPLDASESVDTDGDGVGNNTDTDDDNDGILDVDEAILGFNPLNKSDGLTDSDGDGFSNAVEFRVGTYMYNSNERPGWIPIFVGDIVTFVLGKTIIKNFTVDSSVVNSTTLDDDNDGYSNAVELTEGTNPQDATSIPLDTDGDFIPDSTDMDDDNDGVADYVDGNLTLNLIPVANAGTDQTVIMGDTVHLDGHLSSDDNPQLQYNWNFISKPSGSMAVLSSSSAEKPTFVADKLGSYLLSLRVDDGVSVPVQDNVMITVNQAAPITLDYPNQTYVVGNTISPFVFTNTGGGLLTECTLSDGNVLPSGLSLGISPDGNNCILTGTPTAEKSSRIYSIHSTNITGSSISRGSIRVTVPDIPMLVSHDSVEVLKNFNISPIVFVNNGGGYLTGCSVSPALPTGLSVSVTSDGSSCEITGLPKVSQTQTIYTVTATNMSGDSNATLDLTIYLTVPSPSLQDMSPLVINLTNGIDVGAIRFTNNGGGILSSCTSTKVLPSGLNLGVSSDGHTCEITGVPTETVNADYTINAINTSGSDIGLVHLNISVMPVNNFQLYYRQTKKFRFTWADTLGTDHYRIWESADGAVNNYLQIGTDIAPGVEEYEHFVTLYERHNAKYYIESCNANNECSASAVKTVSNIDIMGSIGHMKITADNPNEYVTGDKYGSAVSISADGNTMAVGVPFEDGNATGVNGSVYENSIDSGAVYIYVRDASNSWVKQAYVKASNTGPTDQFGTTVALNSDGMFLAVGAPNEDSNSTTQNNDSGNNVGAVYLFRFSGGTWTQTAKLKPSNAGSGSGHLFGSALALSADGLRVAVSAKGDNFFGTAIVAGNGVTTNNYGNPNSGAVHLFKYTGSQWNQEAYFKASNSAQNVFFGTAVSINDSGNRMVVGATGIDSSKGAAYVYHRSGSTWTQEQYISNINGDASDHFGNAVSISGNGNTLAIGAHWEDSDTTGLDSVANNNRTNSGAVYLYHRSGTNWTQEEYIKADVSHDYMIFGWTVKLNYSGGFLAVGSPYSHSSNPGIYNMVSNSWTDYLGGNRGAVYVFKRLNGTLGNWAQTAHIQGTDKGFGYAIGLSNDAEVMAVGIPENRVFNRNEGQYMLNIGKVDVY